MRFAMLCMGASKQVVRVVIGLYLADVVDLDICFQHPAQLLLDDHAVLIVPPTKILRVLRQPDHDVTVTINVGFSLVPPLQRTVHQPAIGTIAIQVRWTDE